MNTSKLAARFVISSFAAVALAAASGCSANVDDDASAQSADAVTVHAQRNAGWCTAGERTAFNCVLRRGETKVDGYFISLCAKDGKLQLRHGNVNADVEGQIKRFALPTQPVAANTCAAGSASSSDGGAGRYVRLSGDGSQGYVFEMGRTAPSATGEEIGETVAGVAFENGGGSTTRVLYCSGEPLVGLSSAGVPPNGKAWATDDVYFP